MKRNAEKEIGTFSDPLPYPIIPIHFFEKVWKFLIYS